LANRLSYRVQLTTDGLKHYIVAVDEAFGTDVDYAMLQKIYGTDLEYEGRSKYSPAICIGAEKKEINGTPKSRHISTSFVERNNLTMRMGMRRFTRLTNAFSKKIDNLACAVALHFMHYNFCRVHQSLGTSPAVAAGVTKKLWQIEDIIELLDVKYN
jgi:hypothetical protein